VLAREPSSAHSKARGKNGPGKAAGVINFLLVMCDRRINQPFTPTENAIWSPCRSQSYPNSAARFGEKANFDSVRFDSIEIEYFIVIMVIVVIIII